MFDRRQKQFFDFPFFLTCVCLLTAVMHHTADALLASNRPLPNANNNKLLIGYATECNEKVVQAVRDGINVVIWSFMEIKKQQNSNNESVAMIIPNSLDFEQIRRTIADLDQEGYNDTVHLVSFGGWNGPHLDTSLTEEEWYAAWKNHVGDIFHGIDWDLEGHDTLDSPTNLFTVDCLDFMGRISRLAKQDGYIIGMAPPQSYLDVQSSKFSRQVNLSEPERPWHSEFHYFGANVYTYLLAKYGDAIDFVSVQFYESYSRASMNIHKFDVTPDDYLVKYVDELVNMGQSYWVDFDLDPSLNFASQRVSFPIEKLVFGFANGWARTGDDKTFFFEPKVIQNAYERLVKEGQAPRGFMFWVIGEEGTNGVYYTQALNKILSTRTRLASHEGQTQEL